MLTVWGFNPRTRVGCDFNFLGFIIDNNSFNPRTRVGCDMQTKPRPSPILFQSTHPCGVRRKLKNVNANGYCFNPRTRVGCDAHEKERRYARLFQSTHPCGVRRNDCIITVSHYCFNPRTRVGCDFTYSLTASLTTVSIHAPVWGATITNPFHWFLSCVSIHAPVWGATYSWLSFYFKISFQSTHPCGVRQPIL